MATTRKSTGSKTPTKRTPRTTKAKPKAGTRPRRRATPRQRSGLVRRPRRKYRPEPLRKNPHRPESPVASCPGRQSVGAGRPAVQRVHGVHGRLPWSTRKGCRPDQGCHGADAGAQVPRHDGSGSGPRHRPEKPRAHRAGRVRKGRPALRSHPAPRRSAWAQRPDGLRLKLVRSYNPGLWKSSKPSASASWWNTWAGSGNSSISIAAAMRRAASVTRSSPRILNVVESAFEMALAFELGARR